MTKNKIGRNDPCWCGSGLKYKKCHMDLNKQEPLNRWEAVKRLRKVFNYKDCLAPPQLKSNCSNTFAKAHTVPKSKSLKKIARDGQIYTFIPDPETINKSGGILYPQLCHINKASTFSLFCSKHDDEIFSNIEKKPFYGSQEQCFLLAYRSLAKEIYTKRGLASSIDIMRQYNRGGSSDEQRAIQHINSLMNIGATAALNDNKYYKTLFDNNLLKSDYNSVRAYVMELDAPPPIMCSGSIFPYQDFNGNILQDIPNLNKIPHLLSITSFCEGNIGLIVFTWLSGSDNTCIPFVNSLRTLHPNKTTDGLIRFFFSYCENLHIRPDWWENLTAQQRDILVKRLHIAASLDPLTFDNYGSIVEDGNSFDDWGIRNSRVVGY